MLLGDSLTGIARWRSGFKYGWFCGGFRDRVHFGPRKGKGPGGSRGAERADRYKQLFSSDTDA